MAGEYCLMLATTDAAIHAELNGSLLGRCVLAHAEGFDGTSTEEQWADRLRRCMAQAFENLAAEITVLRQQQPDLTAEAFARLLLVEAELDDDDDEPDDDHEEDKEPDEWLTHPSLTAEQRNCTYPR